jgi:uncharacterized membrane protein YkvA (DUF1232 family)
VDFGLIVGISLGIVAVWAALLVIFFLLRPKGVPLRELIRVIPDVIRLLRSVITDRTAPKDVRLVIGGLFLWIISPIDLIPEFIPVLGPLDDVIVAAVALRYVRRRMGIDDLRTRWTGSVDGFALLERVIGSGARPS